MPVLEEKHIEAYIHNAVNLLYSDVLCIRDLQSHEHNGGGVVISSDDSAYNREEIFIKIDGSSISITEEQYTYAHETIGLEDPSSFERLWKVLNTHVMKMIDKKVKDNMTEMREHQDNFNSATQEQFRLMAAKTHILSKMVTNPIIVDFDDIDLEPKEGPDYDDIPF